MEYRRAIGAAPGLPEVRVKPGELELKDQNWDAAAKLFGEESGCRSVELSCPLRAGKGFLSVARMGGSTAVFKRGCQDPSGILRSTATRDPETPMKLRMELFQSPAPGTGFPSTGYLVRSIAVFYSLQPSFPFWTRPRLGVINIERERKFMLVKREHTKRPRCDRFTFISGAVEIGLLNMEW